MSRVAHTWSCSVPTLKRLSSVPYVNKRNKVLCYCSVPYSFIGNNFFVIASFVTFVMYKLNIFKSHCDSSNKLNARGALSKVTNINNENVNYNCSSDNSITSLFLVVY